MDQIYSQGSGSTGNIKSFNYNSCNKIVNIVNNTVADDKPQVLQWLSPLEPQKRHQHLRNNRYDGMGEWIFKRDEFVKWRTEEDGSHPAIFCEGDPGVGKTYLSSLVIDHLHDRAVRGRRNIKVVGLYCDFLDRMEQTTPNLLGALLKQLVGKGDIPEDIHQAFEAAKEHLGGVGPRLSQLRQMLKTAIASREQVFICVDALDEATPEYRLDLLDALREISQESPSVRIFLTGRPFVRSEVEKYFPDVQVISVSPTTDNIKRYLTMKLDKDTEPDAMDDRLKEEILRIIPETISEIFLLVSLSIETILGETTISKRRKKLHEMTKRQNVGDVYTTTLERIKAQKGSKSRLAMDALMWISHSERPLKPEELCEALGVELETDDLDIDNVPSIRAILACSLGLVTIDSSSSRVRLVHFTLQEYLHANPTLFRSPHSMMAEVCLTYLNFQCIRELLPTLSSAPPTTPFLDYASCHWGTHARKEITESIIPLALKLLDEFDDHVSSNLLVLRSVFQEGGYSDGFTGLHCASYFGIEEIMVALLQTKEWDINATDMQGNTVLSLAARQGHEGVVKMLLDRGDVNPDMADDDDRTPLSWASEFGREGVVKILLNRSDVNPDKVDNNGGTPLLWAAPRGHEKVVKMLLDLSDVNPDMADNGGRTPLSWAAEFGRAGVIMILLNRSDVNPDMADNGGQTPLSWAARQYGSDDVVKMLLDRSDVNPDMADNSGRTPLSWAAYYGSARVTKILLNRSDVNPDMKDNSGRTPLWWAAERGHEAVRHILSERHNANLICAVGEEPDVPQPIFPSSPSPPPNASAGLDLHRQN